MALISEKYSCFKPVRLAAFALIAVLVSACGGGGGSAGGSGSSGSGSGSGGGSLPQVTLVLQDGSGAAISTLSGGQSGTLRATVKSATGAPVASAIVNFTSTETTLVEFNPVSASALTDSTGVAVITVKPATITSAGALAITATSIVGGATGTGSVNLAVGAAPLTVGTLSFVSAPSGALPAFSTVALKIPVASGGAPATSVSGLTLSSLCVGDGLASIVQGSLNDGVQLATYTNNGCLRGTDIITVSIGSSSKTISLAVSPANIGALKFVGSNVAGSSIVLKGSGGVGRSEAAQLTFQVVDEHNNGLAGVDVTFTPTTTTGGLTVSPATGTTDASGNVRTVVSSGTIPTPVSITASATRAGVTISGLSDQLTISTGFPIQKFMSLSADKLNIEGLDNDGQVASLTIRMADQYGNPVSDGTAVNFITEGGAVGTANQGACTTTNGACSVPLTSQAFRPTNGRVTVMAYAQGIEDFIDANGDGQYTCTNFKDASGNTPTIYRPLVDTCVSGGEAYTDLGDAFLDTGSHATSTGVPAVSNSIDGAYDPLLGDLPVPYGHTGYIAAGDGKWGITYIRRATEITFSGSHAIITRTIGIGGRDWDAALDGSPVDQIKGLDSAGCSTQTLFFRVYDELDNPMPSGSVVATVDADKIAPGTMSPAIVGSTANRGGTFHQVSIKPDSGCAHGVFTVKVTSPLGVTSINGGSFQSAPP